MLLGPEGKAEVLKEATAVTPFAVTPFPVTWAVPSCVLPAKNVTVPLG